MSNIPNLSLEELLGDSPKQNLTAGSGNSIGLENEAMTNIPAPFDQQEAQTPADAKEINSQLLLDALLEENRERIRLKKLRDSLLIKRSEVKADAEEVNIRVSYLRSKRKPRKVKKRAKKASFVLVSHDDASSIIPASSFNFLPSNDWPDRLKLIRFFAPYLDIKHQKSLTDYNSSRTFTFTLVSPYLFKVPFELSLSLSNSVRSIEQLSESCLTTLFLLSPAVHQKIVHEYIPNCKLTNIMYCLSSFSSILQQRVTVMGDIIHKFKNFVTNPRFQSINSVEENRSNIKWYAVLRTVDHIDLKVPLQGSICLLVISWKVAVEDNVTGACGADLGLVAHMNSKHVDLSSTFTALAMDHGVVNALETILKSSLKIIL